MLKARNIQYKVMKRASDVPIIQKQLKAYQGEKPVNCALCSQGLAQHSIVFFEDFPHALKLLKSGMSERAVNELLWQKCVREQSRRGVLRAHDVLSVCSSCASRQISLESGNALIAKRYIEGVELNDQISLIIGRFVERPYHPLLVFTVHQDIDSLMEDFRAQAVRGRAEHALYFC